MREMKDSTAIWLGDIPTTWEISRIGSVYTLRNTKVSDKDYEPLSVTMNGVVPQLETAAKTNSHDDRKLVKKGDFAINSRSDRRGSCGIADRDGSVSLINTILCPKEAMNPRYYNWLFHTTEFADEFYANGHGIVDDLWTTGWQEMKRILIPLPPISVQENIANFLDERCPEIDNLTAEIQSQIETLEEYKKSILTEAVTKGLNPDVEMKDSGIEWIGEIPKDWILSRLKYNLSEPMKYGASESGVDYDENLPRYIRITDISMDNKLKNDGKLSLTLSQAKGYMLHEDTVLFARSGATVGKTFLYTPDYGQAAFAGYLISGVADKEKMISKWLYYYTLSNAYWKWANQIFTQATIQNIGADKYNNLPITVPTIQEQQNIVNILDAKCAEIDVIISDRKSQLTTLAEYKKSLIYEYVTGKKEVPNA